MNTVTPTPSDRRRHIPSVDSLLAEPAVHAAAVRFGRERVVVLVRDVCAAARAGDVPVEGILDQVVERVQRWRHGWGPAAVLNATGVVVHTNLGRAPLSAAAQDAVAAAAGACAVEYDIRTGHRGQRDGELRDVLRLRVPVAEDAMVVNNCAAALALVTATLASGREVILSRGEMVEIGAGFRIRDIVAAGGAHVVEVGATNRTHLADYQQAVGVQTGAIVKVHPSNFAVTGFHSSTSVAELSGLPVPLVVDVGSGLLDPHPLLPDEPDVSSALRDGADLVLCSGDKLLGGPQSGLIFGRAELVARLRSHPLARAMRIDKLTIAALTATLANTQCTPVRAALETSAEELRERCRSVAEQLAERAPELTVEVVPSVGTVGGGGAPEVRLPSWAVALPEHYAQALREGPLPIVGRVLEGRTLLDLRCVDPAQDGVVVEAVAVVGDRSL